MKEIVFVSLALLVCGAAAGQTFSEWFRQKKTQIDYLKKQIAALQVYAGVLEKGYAIAKDGLGVIGTVKQEDIDQHSEHFESLKTVKRSIRDDPRVAAIRDVVGKGIAVSSLFSQTIFDLPGADGDLKAWAIQVQIWAANVRSQSESLLDILLSDHAASMADADRLDCLDRMYGMTQRFYHKMLLLQVELTGWINTPKE